MTSLQTQDSQTYNIPHDIYNLGLREGQVTKTHSDIEKPLSSPVIVLRWLERETSVWYTSCLEGAGVGLGQRKSNPQREAETENNAQVQRPKQAAAPSCPQVTPGSSMRGTPGVGSVTSSVVQPRGRWSWHVVHFRYKGRNTTQTRSENSPCLFSKDANAGWAAKLHKCSTTSTRHARY